MTDVHTKKQRSHNMAAIRGKGNKSTEIKLAGLLRKNKINGWMRHYGGLPGRPDFVFKDKKIAIFLDGCFWHGCLVCKLKPATNRKFWNTKIKENKMRDKRDNKQILARDWKVLRFWEHQLKTDPQKVIDKIERSI